MTRTPMLRSHDIWQEDADHPDSIRLAVAMLNTLDRGSWVEQKETVIMLLAFLLRSHIAVQHRPWWRFW